MSISTHSIVSVVELKKQNSEEKETFIASLSQQEIKSEVTEVKSEHSEVKCEVSEVESEITEAKSETSEVRAEVENQKSEISEAAEDKSEIIETEKSQDMSQKFDQDDVEVSLVEKSEVEIENSETKFRDGCTIIETSNKKLVEVFDPKG